MKDMDLSDFLEFYNVAIRKDREERLYEQWCAMLPQFMKYITFDDFLNKVTGKNVDRRPVEEIMADIEETHKKAKEHKDGF